MYFDCNVLEKFDGNQHEFDNIDENKKSDTNIYLMDFISNADFTSVGGQNNAELSESQRQKISPRG